MDSIDVDVDVGLYDADVDDLRAATGRWPDPDPHCR